MNTIERCIAMSILKKYEISNNVLQYTSENAESKLERMNGMFNQLSYAH